MAFERLTLSDVTRKHVYFEDFLHDLIKVGDGSTDVLDWTFTADVGGAQGLDVDGVGGVLSIATDGDDNDEAYAETREMWKFAAGKTLVWEARVQFTEANTDDANILVGMTDAPGANSLQDNGGGPAASYDGCVFFKADGDTVWSFETSQGSTQVTTQGDVTAGGASYHTLRCEAVPISSTEYEISALIDDAGGGNFRHMKDSNGKPIKHLLTMSTPTEMAFVLGAKAGGANAETLLCDYVLAEQLR